jgi:hypothetical protein
MVSQCTNTNLVRLWGFSGGGDGYDARMFNAIENLGSVLQNAPANMKFVVTLSNYYSSGVFQPWPAPEENPTRWFSYDWKTNRFSDFVNQVTTKFKGNSKILIWEVMNEPNCDGSEECTTAQHRFLKDVSDIIAANDPGKLISAGNQAQNTGGEHFDNGEYEDIVGYKNITAATCHLYLEDQNTAIPNCIQALTISKKYNKFFYIGELGYSVGCTAPDCTNTCSQDVLKKRKDTILDTAKDFTDAGAQGIIVWQFSPERNSTLTCDGASVFPEDPFCSIKDNATLNDNTNVNTTKNITNNNQQQNQTNTGSGGFSFNPENPKPGDQLKVIFTSSKGLAWVNLAGEGPGGKKINMAGKTPTITKDSKGYHWTYTIDKVVNGTYTFTFSHDCQRYNKKDTKPEDLAPICDGAVPGKITVGGNNSDSETHKTSNQQQINMDKTNQKCFNISANIKPTNATGGVNFNFTVTVTMTGRRDGHIQLFSSKDPDKDIIAYANGSHPVIISKTVYPDQITWRPTPEASVFVANNQTTDYGFRVKIDECGDLGNMDWVSCKVSVDKNGAPSISGANCSGDNTSITQSTTNAVKINSPGKITLNISAIDPVDPMALEYCQKFQTSNAGCVNPHDQIVEGDTVTMSFPDGNPLIFCGSIPVDKRDKVNGSDRACFMVQQKT